MSSRRPFLVLVAATGLGACADTTPPWQLDHVRILAVRADPPGLAAGQQARLDVLVSDATGAPRVVAPAEVILTGAAAATVVREPDGWSVRAADGLPADPAPATLAITVVVDGELRTATRTVALGVARPALATPVARVDGARIADGTALALIAPTAVALAVDPPADDGATVAWFASAGELADADDAAATLTLDEPAAGWLVAVVRDGAGGIAWATWPVAAR